MNRKLVAATVTAATVLGTTALAASSAWASDSWSGTHKATRSVVTPAKSDSWSVVTPAKSDSWSVTRSAVPASSATPAGTKWISNTIVSPNSRTWAAVPAGVKFTVHSDSSAWA